MNTEETINELMDVVYKICKALITIVDDECCDYGFHDECDIAESYIKHYEADHMKGGSDGKKA